MNERELHLQKKREEYLKTIPHPSSIIFLTFSSFFSIGLGITSAVYMIIRGIYRYWDIKFLWMSLGLILSSLLSVFFALNLNRKIEEKSSRKKFLIILLITEFFCMVTGLVSFVYYIASAVLDGPLSF